MIEKSGFHISRGNRNRKVFRKDCTRFCNSKCSVAGKKSHRTEHNFFYAASQSRPSEYHFQCPKKSNFIKACNCCLPGRSCRSDSCFRFLSTISMPSRRLSSTAVFHRAARSRHHPPASCFCWPSLAIARWLHLAGALVAVWHSGQAPLAEPV